ncbi:MAG: PIN domain-containing protein [Rhodomicrobium sp.]
MSIVAFFDTNILLYTIGLGPAEQTKQAVAIELVKRTDAGLSVQVLQEFYVQATRPTRPDPLSHRDASDLIEAWTRFAVQPMTLDVLMAALDIKQRHRFSYWDSAIVAAALALGCRELYTEDVQDGLTVDGLRLIDPFL